MNLIIFSSTLVLVESIQVWLLVAHAAAIQPLWSLLVFVFCVLCGQWLALSILPQRWERPAFRASAWRYLLVEGILLGLLLSASYKLVIYDFQPQLAGRAFAVLMTAAVLNKIFWKKAEQFCSSLYAFLTDPLNRPALSVLADAGFVVFIVLFIYVPDAEAVIARMFVGDQFHHFDLFMAPAWASLKGLVSYVDIISQYGIGIPMVMGFGSQLFGGFSYEHVFMLLMVLCIIYYVATYVFLRCWLKSIPLVIIAMLVGLKTQMFHTGVSPFVFTYPSATIVRNFFDVFFFLCIWGHLTHGRRILLWLAALLCVLAEFNLIDTGIYLIGAYYAYLALICWLPDLRARFAACRKDWLGLAGCFLFIPLAGFVLLHAAAGQYVFTKAYWYNMAEYVIYFLAGHGTIPYSESFYYHYFWAAAIGFAVPLVYLASLLAIGLLCYWRRVNSAHVLVMVLCIYGLGVYHYYVARTAVTSYYVSGLPFIFVCCFWLQQFLAKVSAGARAKVLWGLVLWCWFCLWTNHQVLAYPNIFNFSRNPMVDPLVTLPVPDQRGYFNNMFMKFGPDYKLPVNSLGKTDEMLVHERDFSSDDQLKAFYERESNFSKDAALIDSLTAPGDKTAILSNFEVKLLMQADRKPFFYFCPFVMSSPLHMRIFPLENVYSAAYLTTTLRQLESEKPAYVFMERIFLIDQVPAAYQDDYPRLLALINFIRGHYKPQAYGQYLVAMKRI